MASNFKSKKHKETFERNMAKGFVAATLTRAHQLTSSTSLWPTERESMKRIAIEMKQNLKNWRKLPPKHGEIEWID